MISVIIPALNEERTIANVVGYCFAQECVSQVIVVDNNSNDETFKEAKRANAMVLKNEEPGKGSCMMKGISHAINELVVFLDADIDPYPLDTISLLTNPILEGRADFVKGTFARNAGRVTELVAKPLIMTLFPPLIRYSQPLSGMIAGKKVFFEQIEFLNDYGVDIGILIDMHFLRARIDEVNIGYIQNKSKPWNCLVKMSREVAGAILQKAFSDRTPIELNLPFTFASV